MNIVRRLSFPLFTVLSIFGVVLFTYRSLTLHMGTNLIDWNDYPLVVWIQEQNISHLVRGDFMRFFETNAFYPHTKTLLFSELLFPTSVLGAIFHLFSSNVILTLNLVFFSTWMLNIVASYTLWKNRFSGLTLWFAVLVTALSPFLLLNTAHFQIINVWPMFFALSQLLFQKDFSRKHAFWLGVWISVQFWSSIYLGMFLSFSVGIWWLLQIVRLGIQKEKLFTCLQRVAFTLFVCIGIAGPLLFQYWLVQQRYEVVREDWEYVRYASDIADYFFTDQYGSLISTAPLINQWNRFRKSGGTVGFPGFALGALSVIGILRYSKSKKNKLIGVSIDTHTLYFGALLVCGFLFSLGSRLTVNGTYLVIPLPYYIVQKTLFFFSVIRGTSRWAILFYVALGYFASVGLEKLTSKSKRSCIVAMVFSALYIAEIVPINRITQSREYYPEVYKPIAQECAQYPDDVLIEYPLMFDTKKRTAGDVVQYWSQIMFASLFHQCKMVNGYSGFFPKPFEELRARLEGFVANDDKEMFLLVLQEYGVSLLKLNKHALDETNTKKITQWLHESTFSTIFEDDTYLVIRLK